MSRCTITVRDEVNCLLTGIDQNTKYALKKLLTFEVPGARHMPKYKLGVWNGQVSLFKEGWTYTNLIDEDFIGVLEEAGYDIEIVDDRGSTAIQCEHVDEGSFSHLTGAPLLRDYQVAAINTALDSRSGILVMATGAGKSFVCGAVASRMLPHGRVITIVPTVNLVAQTADSYRALGMADVGEFSGIEKRVSRSTVTTWQSLANYPEIVEGTVCVICDEVHQAKAQVLQDILTGPARNVPHRYGFTGTLPTDELSRAKLRACFGDVLFEKGAWELQQSGVLAGCHVNVVQTVESKSREFEDYHEENAFLVTNGPRLAWIASFISGVAESGNTMVLVRNVATGDKLASLMGDRAVFISGSTSPKKRKAEYDSMRALSGKILVCTKGIASTGIDIPRIFNRVLIEAGKSFTEVVQSIGRGLRRAEDKDHVEIYDICASTKHSKRHLGMRKRYYKEARYPFTVLKVDYQC